MNDDIKQFFKYLFKTMWVSALLILNLRILLILQELKQYNYFLLSAPLMILIIVAALFIILHEDKNVNHNKFTSNNVTSNKVTKT